MDGQDLWHDSWYVDANDITHATLVIAPAYGSRTVNIIARLAS